MDSEDSGLPSLKCCNCGCNCSNTDLAGGYIRSVKRKVDELDEESVFTIPGFVIPQNARIGIDNECMALRETVRNQQQTIQDLISELEEERNASSSATSEAMSMILKLQREKADIQMEARQFKRFAEEKMAHDQEEMLELDDLLYKREQVIQLLACEVQAYKHRMMSYGITEVGADDEGMSQNTSLIENIEGQFEFPPCEIFYPPLKCTLNESQVYPDGDDEAGDVEKYAFGETPRSRDQLEDLEYRINQLEKSPKNIQPDGECIGEIDVLEKVVNDHFPREAENIRKFSADFSSAMSKEMGQDLAPDSPKSDCSFKKMEILHVEGDLKLRKVDNASEVGDDMSDRVYTIDSVHQGVSFEGAVHRGVATGICSDDFLATSRESPNHSDGGDLEIQKLYARLHALEADRESMRQAIVSIGTEKAQLVLLKEIAQNLCKEMSPEGRMPVRKQSVDRNFSFLSIFKWIISFIFWRRKTHRCKYSFGLSANNSGLLMLLDRSPRVGQWRSISSTRMPSIRH